MPCSKTDVPPTTGPSACMLSAMADSPPPGERKPMAMPRPTPGALGAACGGANRHGNHTVVSGDAPQDHGWRDRDECENGDEDWGDRGARFRSAQPGTGGRSGVLGALTCGDDTRRRYGFRGPIECVGARIAVFARTLSSAKTHEVHV